VDLMFIVCRELNIQYYIWLLGYKLCTNIWQDRHQQIDN